MDKRGLKTRAHIWERVLEIGFALLVVGGITTWVIIDKHSSKKAPVSNTTNSLNVVATAPIGISLAYVSNGLSQVTAIEHIPGDGRLFVAEQKGTVRVIKDGQLLATTFLDIQKKVKNTGELGMLGLAFDPSFSTNHFVYVHYSDTKDSSSVVARYTSNADATVADPASEKVILRQPQPFPNHNGGQIAFGPEDYLYIGFGDGGSSGDPQKNGQNMETWLGKILRIDVHAGNPYSVPTDNPYVNTPGAKPEIWDVGLRNPWRFSFDDFNNYLVIADVGQGKKEEINIENFGHGGNNYGWRCYEGADTYQSDGCPTTTQYQAPRLTYDHTEKRCSVTGGYTYNAGRLSGFRGRYFYADYCTGEIWSVALNQKTEAPRREGKFNFPISTFGVDNEGNLYVADYQAGIVYRIVRSV